METTLELPPEITAQGIQSLSERQAATIAALDSFMEQDGDEHRETLRVLRRSLTVSVFARRPPLLRDALITLEKVLGREARAEGHRLRVYERKLLRQQGEIKGEAEDISLADQVAARCGWMAGTAPLVVDCHCRYDYHLQGRERTENLRRDCVCRSAAGYSEHDTAQAEVSEWRGNLERPPFPAGQPFGSLERESRGPAQHPHQ